MTRLWREGIEIEVKAVAPHPLHSFIWQGRTHVIEKVRQHWQVDTDWWSEEGRAHRDYYAVTTTDGMLCVMYFDFLDEQWYLAQVYD